MLSSYKNVPIYLRIGAEFNVWGDKCTPDEFVSAFKAVANSVSDCLTLLLFGYGAHIFMENKRLALYG